jgi:hypothetical protein
MAKLWLNSIDRPRNCLQVRRRQLVRHQELLVANAFLEREVEFARVAVSFGYSRGWHLTRGRAKDA